MTKGINVWGALLLLIAALIFSPRASADDSGIISVFGLSFVCKDCEVRTEPSCRVVFATPNQILTCDEAAARLLNEAVGKSRAPEHPDAAELRRFLLSGAQPAEAATAAVKLLLRSDAGRRALIVDAFTFATKYESVLAEAVSDNADEAEVWLTYWRLPSREGINLTTNLRARIFASTASLTEDDLYGEMTIVKPEADLKSLDAYRAEMSARRPELAAALGSVRSYLERCQGSVLEGGADDACGKTALAELAPAAQKFIERVRIEWLIHAIGDGKLTLADFVERLNRIDYEKVRTPAVHETLVKALDAAKAGPEKDRERMTAEKLWPMFKLFSENDRLIAHRWATVLSIRANELFEAGTLEQSSNLFEASFDAVPEPVEARAEVLKKMVETKIWGEHPEIQERFRNVVRRVIPEPPWWAIGQKKLVGIFAILCGLTFVWIMLAYNYKMKRQEQLQAELLALAEQEELAELREFFGIGAEDGEPELTKSYRRKAKETHPDIHQNTMEEFKELQIKYQRTRDLILGIRRDENGEIITPRGEDDASGIDEDGEPVDENSAE